jgi:hypothetical protein
MKYHIKDTDFYNLSADRGRTVDQRDIAVEDKLTEASGKAARKRPS